ncbi:MAG TPA: hydrogen gas-evolving membrane-bound hydrogenase subunit E [Oceanipulchritudo sp.]|nr:hydrogen gas-evolving membrane-bound hydrogenase subunit E [Oceanipulchritudo sp.]
MKAFRFLFLAAFFAVLFWASFSLPPRGDLKAPAMQELSRSGSLSAGSYYMENSYRETHTENIVTAVLADYRAFDTLGETLVVFVAGVACALILRKRGDPS